MQTPEESPGGLKSLLPHERPQERLEKLGASALSDTELVAMILRSGSPKSDVLSVSAALLRRAGSLAGLLRLSRHDLLEIHGLGKVKSLQMLAILEISRRVLLASRLENDRPITSALQVYERLHPIAAGLDVEKFWVLCLNRKNRILSEKEVTSGTATASLVHPREVFREAVRISATAVIIAHNHPSGDPAPSVADCKVTRSLADAGKLMDIELLDHIVIGDAATDPSSKGFFSFRDSGLI